LSGPVSKVTVTLLTMNHTFPDDIDILLVGPTGQKMILMSDAGGSPDLINVTLTFDDAAPTGLPDSTLIAPGTYRPTNFGTGDTFPAPAPAGPYGSALSVFNGQNPNGTWSLFVNDDAGGDSGNISGGWRIGITTSSPVCCTEACTLTCPADMTAANDPRMCGAVVSYPPIGVSGSCGTVASSPASGSFFPVGTTGVTATGTSTGGGGITGTCGFNVMVNDEEDPTLVVTLSPDFLWPPNHRMMDVSATVTASDNCGSATVLLTSVMSNEADNSNGVGDGNTVNDIQGADTGTSDLMFSVRAERAGGGQGRFYTATYTATDGSGNTAVTGPTVFVPHDQGGTAEPLILGVAETVPGTLVQWDAVPGAGSYSVIRGQVSGLREETHFINLGAVSCLAASTPALSIAGQEDAAIPALGEAFLYAAAYSDAAGSSSYGSVSAAKPRVTGSGNCE
jgi:subtilisin-like proprotein convertase family protein